MTPNTLAFIALANEYCAAIERDGYPTAGALAREMTRLLPRIYICAADLPYDESEADPEAIVSALDETTYESVRMALASVLGEHDSYLGTADDDMRYSEAPTVESVSEGLADVFQVMYDFVATVRDSTEEVTDSAVLAVSESFARYWGNTLCTIMRPLNLLRNLPDDETGMNEYDDYNDYND